LCDSCDSDLWHHANPNLKFQKEINRKESKNEKENENKPSPTFTILTISSPNVLILLNILKYGGIKNAASS